VEEGVNCIEQKAHFLIKKLLMLNLKVLACFMKELKSILMAPPHSPLTSALRVVTCGHFEMIRYCKRPRLNVVASASLSPQKFTKFIHGPRIMSRDTAEGFICNL
jgi:hypothetical protein